MDEVGAIVASLEATNCFIILVSRMRKTFNSSSSRPTSDGLLELDQFLGIQQTSAIVNGSFKLFPKCLPVKNISIKRWDIQLWELGGLITDGSGSFGRA